MSFRRRRRAAQSVYTESLPFDDSTDGLVDTVVRPGANHIHSLPEVPRPGVYRRALVADIYGDDLARLLLPRTDLSITSSGPWGMGRQPHGSLRRLQVPRWGAPPRGAHRPTIPPLQAWAGLNVLRERHPQSVVHCVRRKVRRSVLFARDVAGRRGGSPGPYHRNEFSQWSCR